VILNNSPIERSENDHKAEIHNIELQAMTEALVEEIYLQYGTSTLKVKETRREVSRLLSDSCSNRESFVVFFRRICFASAEVHHQTRCIFSIQYKMSHKNL